MTDAQSGDPPAIKSLDDLLTDEERKKLKDALFGGWQTTVPEYVDAVRRYQSEIGALVWAAPMDWMCEPWIIEKTGLSVREHQERTVQNFLDLEAAWGLANDPPFIPVLQGWTLEDYRRCLELYCEAGVGGPLFGLGSVCRRQHTNARRSPPLPGCTHKSCSNCLRYALEWRKKVERSLEYVHVPLFEEVA